MSFTRRDAGRRAGWANRTRRSSFRQTCLPAPSESGAGNAYGGGNLAITAIARVNAGRRHRAWHPSDRSIEHAFEALKSAPSTGAPDRGLDRRGNLRCLPALLVHMEGHLPLFERNRTSLSGPSLFGQFRRVVDEVIREEIAASGLAGEIADGRRDFVVGGVFGMLERWCGEGCRAPRESVLGELYAYVGLVLGSRLAIAHGGSRR